MVCCGWKNNLIVSDTRETGFVNAIIAAGITFQVTRACSKGDLLGCSCDKKMKYKINNRKKHHKYNTGKMQSNYEWRGCGGDNINYGMKRSKDFLDRHKNRSDVKNLVKLHNYIAGRLVSPNMLFTCCFIYYK